MIIDIHSHLLPNVDDGAVDMDMAMEMLRIGVEEGTTNMVLTPHYIQGYYENTKESLLKGVQTIQVLANQAGMKIELYCGNEIHIDDNLIKLIEQGKVLPLNNSRYLLIEFSMFEIPYYADEILYRIMLKGFVPIIAHPERNMLISKDINIVKRLVERGVLMQVNGDSINGSYGKTVAKSAFEIIKKGLANFVASDAHSNTHKTPGLRKARKNIVNSFNESLAQKIFYENPMKVILNESIY